MRISHFSCAIVLKRILFAVVMVVATQTARGDVLDGVELERRGPNADISIRFTVPVQYLRHLPLDAGKILRIFPRFTGTTVTTASPDTFRLPETDMVPRFTVTYSSTDNALVIDFDQPTKFSVRSGTDGRSIVITVPTLPGAKDWALQASPAPRAPAPPPVAAAPAAAPVTPPAPPAPAPKAPPAAASTAQAPPAAQQQPTAPAPKPAPAIGSAPIVPAAPTVPLAKEEVESQAAKLMAAAQLAIDAQRGVAAAERLNQVLALPPNSHTEKAQALMGEAREYSGESIKARAEYEQYLKQYPNGSHAPRVKERLAALGKTLSQTSAALGLKPVTDGGAPWTIFGGLSQYYYTGHTQIETITPPPPGQLLFNRDNLSLTDQRSLITNLDIQARRRDAVTDTRFVFRDTDNRNFLNNSRSYNRVNSAYVEQTNKEYGYFVRAGRQTGTGNGAPGRFDGVNAGYNLNPEWRINGIVGEPVEFNSEFHRQMYGMSVDYTAQLGKPGGSVYFIEQSLEGVRDRRAVGSELRYFDPNLTMFGTLEYEIDYRRMNLAMMQANLRTDAGTNYFANIDIRKSPPLGLLTSLPGQISLDPFAPTLNFRSLFFDSVNGLGVDELRRQSTILTATSYLYSLGFTHPVTPRWQLGADYRNASISGTGESGIVAAAPASGTSHVFSGQALGNGILVENDSTVANVSLIAAPTYAGQAYSVSYGIPYQAWRLDATMRLYTQTDDQDQRQTRISPTLKVAYRWRNKVSFEVEAGLEKFTETGPLRETNSRRYYIFGGYRWDFQ